jgi:hypothetical protein
MKKIEEKTFHSLEKFETQSDLRKNNDDFGHLFENSPRDLDDILKNNNDEE